MNTVYGPVPSWRLGRSLGIDVICRKEKFCSFDCVYCQQGKTVVKTRKREKYIDIIKLRNDLNDYLSDVKADVITISGTGEPTLASNLDEVIEILGQYSDLPTAILTNSSLLLEEEIRGSLEKIDIVVAKLDAPDDKLFQKINHPVNGIVFDDIINGIKKFQKVFKGKLALQLMFIEDNMSYADEMADITRELKPDEVQINTPLRPCPIPPLSQNQIESIEKYFQGQNVIDVYSCCKPKFDGIDKNEILKRRGVIGS